MSLTGEIAADSSFYICFLDCINCTDDLVRILENFKMHIPNKVFSEIQKSNNWTKIKDHKNLNIFSKAPFNIGESLKPFFSKNQIEKGEHEIIVIAYLVHQMNPKCFYFILDDGSPRKFVENNFKDLLPFMKGTVGFIKVCFSDYSIFNKDETISIFNKIKGSNFRIKREIINKLEEDIK